VKVVKFGALLSGEGKDYFYIMHLSYDGEERERLWNYAKENNIIGLSHKYVEDDWTKVRKKAKNLVGKGWVRQFDSFCRLEKGDIVMLLNGMDSVLGVAIATESKHRYDENLNDVFFDHTRRVEWKVKYEFTRRKNLPKLLEGFSHTLSRVTKKSPRWHMLVNLDL